jgi:hypothetical protein
MNDRRCEPSGRLAERLECYRSGDDPDNRHNPFGVSDRRPRECGIPARTITQPYGPRARRLGHSTFVRRDPRPPDLLQETTLLDGELDEDGDEDPRGDYASSGAKIHRRLQNK